MEFEDGTYGVIDCKFQGKDNDKSDFYAPQLEAYAYALENPVSGEPRKVSVIGLLVWSPKKPLGDPYEGFSLGLNSSWFPITRNPEGSKNVFKILLKSFLVLRLFVIADAKPVNLFQIVERSSAPSKTTLRRHSLSSRVVSLLSWPLLPAMRRCQRTLGPTFLGVSS